LLEEEATILEEEATIYQLRNYTELNIFFDLRLAGAMGSTDRSASSMLSHE
jgi:hypothetical protein